MLLTVRPVTSDRLILIPSLLSDSLAFSSALAQQFRRHPSYQTVHIVKILGWEPEDWGWKTFATLCGPLITLDHAMIISVLCKACDAGQSMTRWPVTVVTKRMRILAGTRRKRRTVAPRSGPVSEMSRECRIIRFLGIGSALHWGMFP